MKTPYFELSKSKLYENIDFLKKYFNQISYSYKSNTIIGDMLNEDKDIYFSIHNIKELKNIEDKKRVWYFLLATNFEELKNLFEKYNLKNFVVDNLEDFEILKSFIEKNDYKINLLLRCKLYENTLFHGKHYYFGMKLNEVKTIINENYNSKNILGIGIHTHRKTQNVSEWNIKEEVIEFLGSEILSKISFFNLGGGLPSDYKNSHNDSITNIFKLIKELKEIFDRYDIKFIIEPGRFIAGSPIKLISHIKLIVKDVIFLDVSIFNGSLDTVVANVKLKVLGELEQNEGEKYLLKGLTPDSQDILRYRVYLKNPKVGDKIIFLNAGAYNYQTDFCSLDKLETKFVK